MASKLFIVCSSRGLRLHLRRRLRAAFRRFDPGPCSDGSPPGALSQRWILGAGWLGPSNTSPPDSATAGPPRSTPATPVIGGDKTLAASSSLKSTSRMKCRGGGRRTEAGERRADGERRVGGRSQGGGRRAGNQDGERSCCKEAGYTALRERFGLESCPRLQACYGPG